MSAVSAQTALFTAFHQPLPPQGSHLRASWKICSSVQAGCASANCLALLLCSRSSNVVMVRGNGFWFMLGWPLILPAASQGTHPTQQAKAAGCGAMPNKHTLSVPV